MTHHHFTNEKINFNNLLEMREQNDNKYKIKGILRQWHNSSGYFKIILCHITFLQTKLVRTRKLNDF